MKLTGNKLVFAIALFAGAALVLAKPVYERLTEPPPAKLNRLSEGIYITEQVTPGQVARLSRQGFMRIVDLRPDGEEAGQPDSDAMRAAAQANGVAFNYVPVLHGKIPDTAVAALDKALAPGGRGLVLMYCRSGRRAARTWGLVEASRPGGQGADAIIAAVKSSGQSADDLREEIVRRVAARPALKESKS